MVKCKTGKRDLIKDKQAIESMVCQGKHVGTSFIKGTPGVLKTKTFNLYEMENGEYLVTNHYGDELINAVLYGSIDDLKVNFPEGKDGFRVYKFPILP